MLSYGLWLCPKAETEWFGSTHLENEGCISYHDEKIFNSNKDIPDPNIVEKQKRKWKGNSMGKNNVLMH